MVQSEAQKRAKAKYYAKLKEDPQYRDDMARRQKEYYNKNKANTLIIKKYEHIKEKRGQDKLILWFRSWYIVCLALLYLRSPLTPCCFGRAGHAYSSRGYS